MRTTSRSTQNPIELELLQDGRIGVFTIHQSNRQAVDAWVEQTLEYMKSWDGTHPYLALHDVSKAIFSPYGRQRAQELAKYNAEYKLYGNYAVVVPSGIVGNIIALFVNRDFRRMDQSELEGRCFTNRDEALQWLESQLNAEA